MRGVHSLSLAAALILAAARPAFGDPSGYLKPAGDEQTVERAARAFRDGVRALDTGAAGTAMGRFSRAASLCPDFFEARYNIAKLEGTQYGPDRAVEALQALCKDFPGNVRAYSDLGQLLIATDLEAAGDAFGTAVANGEKLLQDEAIAAAGAATIAQLKVDLAFAYHNRGAWRLAEGDHAKAEADLRRSVELNNENFFSHYGLGLALLQQGKYTEAKTAFKQSQRLKSPFADCSIGMARAYLGETPPQPAAALVELRAAEKAAGRTAQTETLYGDAYTLLGKQTADEGRADETARHLAEAKRRYAGALEVGADAATIAFKLGIVAANEGDYGAARERLRECIENAGEPGLKAQALTHLGVLAEREEHYAEAIVEFRAAAATDPKAYAARLHLGVCLFQAGKPAEAERELSAVIEALGDTPPPALAPDLEQARKLLDKIRHSGDNHLQTDAH
ncbi:MAG: tetratricopeptide repeat protein [Verrucomicrobia bacterium]|nr:tetratricopeptide repeat protein [Verrucomicrobiota bacterium]